MHKSTFISVCATARVSLWEGKFGAEKRTVVEILILS